MDIKKIRKSTGLRQTKFWGRVGVSQSAGCRYELGRPVPRGTQMLINIAYGTEMQRFKTLKALGGL